jgi:hypothetical protein
MLYFIRWREVKRSKKINTCVAVKSQEHAASMYFLPSEKRFSKGTLAF